MDIFDTRWRGGSRGKPKKNVFHHHLGDPCPEPSKKWDGKGPNVNLLRDPKGQRGQPSKGGKYLRSDWQRKKKAPGLIPAPQGVKKNTN